MFQRETDQSDRERPDDDIESHTGAFCESTFRLGRAREITKKGNRHLPEVTPEVHDDRGNGPELHYGDELGPRFRVIEVHDIKQFAGKREMSRAADREELSQPLDDAEENRVEGVHVQILSGWCLERF